MYIGSAAIFVFLIFGCESISFLKKNDQNISLQVTTKNGIVQGTEKHTVKKNIFFSYEGIPFAQPPIRNLRFRGPKPAKRWKGVLNATAMTQICIEAKVRYIGIELSGEEDCLYLNVYTPKNGQLSKGELLPVIFWIHGGGFLEGNPTEYGPHHLIDKNLVVVTSNYRVGAFGFLSTQDEACPGNYGLKDQNAALQWVNKNIEQFGGDPRRVTVAGQSAGASSVMHHVLSPKSRGLLSRAIAWSGETTSIWSNQKNPKEIALGFAMNLGIETKNTTEIIEKLRRVDVDDLKNAEMMTIIAHGPAFLQDGSFFTPVIEVNNPDAFFTQPTYERLKRGQFSRVPLMIGTTTMEFGMFARIFDLIRPILLYFDMSPSSIPNGIPNASFMANRQAGQKLKEKYFESQSFAGSNNEELINFFTDLLFTVPITRTIKAMSPFIPIYFFVSAQPQKQVKYFLESQRYPININTNGVVHAEDIPLIWYYRHFGTSPKSNVIHKKFLQLWKNFASTGNPTPTFDPEIGIIWPRVTDNRNISYMIMENDVKIAYNYKKDIINIWEEILNEYIKK